MLAGPIYPPASAPFLLSGNRSLLQHSSISCLKAVLLGFLLLGLLAVWQMQLQSNLPVLTLVGSLLTRWHCMALPQGDIGPEYYEHVLDIATKALIPYQVTAE